MKLALFFLPIVFSAPIIQPKKPENTLQKRFWDLPGTLHKRGPSGLDLLGVAIQEGVFYDQAMQAGSAGANTLATGNKIEEVENPIPDFDAGGDASILLRPEESPPTPELPTDNHKCQQSDLE